MTIDPQHNDIHLDELLEEPPAAETGKRFFRFMIDLLETIILAVVLYLAINFLSARVYVEGWSMVPTFNDGDFLIVNRVAYDWGEYERGDVIVFPYPGNPEEDYIKRVIGLPGDTVQIQDGEVFVNGVPINEPYIAEPPINDFSLMTVPDGTVFVMGDNRNDSSDSRSWGPLDMDVVIGKAILRYWPLDDFSLVRHPDIDLMVTASP